MYVNNHLSIYLYNICICICIYIQIYVLAPPLLLLEEGTGDKVMHLCICICISIYINNKYVSVPSRALRPRARGLG